MVFSDTIMCSTDGNVSASSAVALNNPMTGQPATLPEGAIVTKIIIYRDGDTSVTGGCTMQLGIVGATSKYIGVGEGLSTTALNNGHLLLKKMTTDSGLTSETELRLTLNNSLTTGAITFEISYATYA